jgi:N-acetylneuraminic acid mutarotase
MSSEPTSRDRLRGRLVRMSGAVTVAAGVAVASPAAAGPDDAVGLAWSPVTPLPDAHGFAGMFAGYSNGTLLAAGGANFPDAPLTAGGTKTWTDRVFLLEAPGGAWRTAPTRLPRPLGYGVSASHADRVVFVGGSNVDGHYADAFALRVVDGDVVIEPLPPLPEPLAQMSGAVVDGVLYIAGGLSTPASTQCVSAFYALDLDDPDAQWRALPTWPGPARCLAIAGAADGRFFLFSGMTFAANAQGRPYPVAPYLLDAYAYTPGLGDAPGTWQRLADLPRPLAGSPSPALRLRDGRLALLGGLSGENLGAPLDGYPPFYRGLHAYDPSADAWGWLGFMPAAMPRVVASTVEWAGQHVVVSGETMPGVRSPMVQGITEPPAADASR